MKIRLSILAIAACTLLPALPLAAATVPAAATKVTKNAPVPNAWPAETLSGKIAMVDAAHNLVVVKTPDGVPYDMDITGKTRIKAGKQSVAVKDLTGDINKNVSVNFVPEGRGDVARSININK